MTDALKFHQIVPDAAAPLRADKAALGTLPTGAFQYCEPIRTASAYGWYVFPPDDIRLYWDGVDVYFWRDEQWELLSRTHLSSEFLDHWRDCAPDELADLAPPFLTSVFVPGIVQIWSGLFVSTAEGWSTLIGPLANLPQSPHYFSFEGIVETDRFCPWPLFTNIKLLTTDREIFLPKSKPIFQVRPLQRESYAESAQRLDSADANHTGLFGANDMSANEWKGYRSTIRSSVREEEPRDVGSYGATSRRRSREGQ